MSKETDPEGSEEEQPDEESEEGKNPFEGLGPGGFEGTLRDTRRLASEIPLDDRLDAPADGDLAKEVARLRKEATKLRKKTQYQFFRAEISPLVENINSDLNKYFQGYNKYVLTRRLAALASDLVQNGVDPRGGGFVRELSRKFFTTYDLRPDVNRIKLESLARNIAFRIQDAAVAGGIYKPKAYPRMLDRNPHDDHVFGVLRERSGFDSESGPYDLDALHELGKASYKRGEPEESIRFFELLLNNELENPYVWARLEKAKAVAASGNLDEAIRLCEQEGKIELPEGEDKRDHDTWVFHGLGKYHLQKAEQIEGSHTSMERIQEFSKAKKKLIESIDLDPNNGWHHHDLSRVYSKQGKFREAIDELDEARRLLEEHSLEHHRFHVGYVVDEIVIVSLNKASKEFIEESAKRPLMRDLFYLCQNWTDTFINERRAQLKAKNDSPETEGYQMKDYLASVSGTEEGDVVSKVLSTADSFADGVVEHSTNWQEGHCAGDVAFRISWMHTDPEKKREHLHKALDFYKKSLQFEDTAPSDNALHWTYANMSFAYQDLGCKATAGWLGDISMDVLSNGRQGWRERMKSSQRILTSDYFNRAKQVREEKSYDIALEMFEMIAAADQNHVGAQYQIGLIHGDTGKTDLARQYFEKTLELDPGHGGAQEALEALPPAQ